MTRLARPLPVLAWALFLVASGCDDAPRQQGQAPPNGEQAPEECLPAKPWPQVHLVRTPDGGIHPQAVERKGVHLLYFKGDPRGGDLFYAKGHMLGGTVKLSKAVRVNSQPGSAVAPPDVCAAQLAVSEDGRAHVAWMGSAQAEPRAPGGETPLLYSRLDDAGTAFEPQRNLIQRAVGLEGGCTLVAEGQQVWVYWHAPDSGQEGEGNRRVWMALSTDGGKTFGPKDFAISPADTGVCAGSGLRAHARLSPHPGVLYRSAAEGVHRDVYFLRDKHGWWDQYQAVKLDAWQTETCPKSTWGLHWTHQGWVAAWEAKGQIHYAHLDFRGKPTRRFTAPGAGGKRKHPVVHFSGRDLLLAWTEGGAAGQGDAVAWQVYTGINAGKDQPAPPAGAILHTSGRAGGVPAGGLISVVSQSDQFVIFY
jgi:hypothetical protein